MTVSRDDVEVNWDRSLNLTAYGEVEAASNYPTEDALDRYRDLLLEKSLAAANFVKALAFRESRLNVLELCSGSSRLLYAMDRLGIIDAATGVEVSASRHQFAQSWKDAIGAQCVTNIHSSANDYVFDRQGLDVVVLIDGALSYIYPTDPAFSEAMLRQAHRHLVSGGRVILEFASLADDQRNAMKRDGDFRYWYRGDEKDAFAFALYQTEAVNWQHKVVQNTSIYVPRNGAPEKIKREHYKYYDIPELDALFAKTGFRATYYGSFGFAPHTVDAGTLIAVAIKE